ncbi:group II intron reverse transcriptase domain-containing protein [Candidatus Micrarchaeota archaeon]|nr:group II intron reverse transcriptase domain-containing protein [Candidatus Micrarchaeota archaeon]
MKTYKNMYPELCSYENLELAFRKARTRKTQKEYVIGFGADLENNLMRLKAELDGMTYLPAPQTIFAIRDPKTRRISASHFRDRVVHHALCNAIEPVFEKRFIYDSYANRKGKGTHAAIQRFERFLREASQNERLITANQKTVRFPQEVDGNCIVGYALKADIKHYFDSVDHQILLEIIQRRVRDPRVLWLIKVILGHHKTPLSGKGMPLGNLTSQFFANVYLDEFDQFVKHTLKARHYIRYVDDFVILHRDKALLERWKDEISVFLHGRLELELHHEKTNIIPLRHGVTFLGFRIFAKYRLLKKSNARRIWKRLERFRQRYEKGEMTRKEAVRSLEGWLTYASFADTYNLRRNVVSKFNELFGR